MFKSEQLQKEFDNILDTFSGTDGGIRFIKLQCFLKEFENRSETESSARQILDVMSRFSKLIDVANKK